MKKLFLLSFSILLLSFFTLNASAQSKDSGKTIQNAQVRIEQLGSFISSTGIDGGVKEKILSEIEYTKSQMAKATAEITDYKALIAKKSDLYKNLMTNIGKMVPKKEMSALKKWNNKMNKM